MGSILSRVGSQSFLVLLAVILSYVLLVTIGAYFPEVLAWLLDGAELVESAVNGIRFDNGFFNSAINFLIGEETILILFFSLLSRVIIAFIGGFAGTGRGFGWVINRITSQSTILILSFALSFTLLVLIWWRATNLMTWLQDQAQIIERVIEHNGVIPNLYNNWLRIIVTDETILVVFFAILARILIAILATSLTSAFVSRN